MPSLKFYPAVEAVGHDYVQETVVPNRQGELYESFPVLNIAAGGDGVFKYVPDHGAEIHVGNGKGFLKGDIKGKINAVSAGGSGIIVQQGVHRAVAAVVYDIFLRKAVKVGIQISVQGVKIALFRHILKGAYRLPEVMAGLGGLIHVFEECIVLAFLHFQDAVLFLRPCSFQDAVYHIVEDEEHDKPYDKQRNEYQCHGDGDTIDMIGLVFLRPEEEVDQADHNKEREGGVPCLRNVEPVDKAAPVPVPMKG